MTGIRVTDAAVTAACREAVWDWSREVYVDPHGREHLLIPSPAESMRPILEAAAAHMVDDRVAAALELHRPDNDPCDYMLEQSPCSTARALGVESS